MTRINNIPVLGAQLKKLRMICLIFGAGLLAVACSDSAIAPNNSSHKNKAVHYVPSSFNVVKVTVNLDKNGHGTAQAVSLGSSGTPPVAANITNPGDGNPGNHTGAEGTIQFKPISVQNFNTGQYGNNNGFRYFIASFAVRNADENKNAYTQPLKNLTFIALDNNTTYGSTAIADLQKYDGSSIAQPINFAKQMIPTGLVGLDNRHSTTKVSGVDLLQVYSENTVGNISVSNGVTLFPYGFTVLNKNDGSRTLPAGPSSSEFDGVFTFAFKMPMAGSYQALRQAPYHFVFYFKPVVDSDLRITQAPEEQSKKGNEMLADHIKNDLGGISNVDKVVVFPGSRFWQYGEPKTMIKCTPTRVAGTPPPPQSNIITALLTPNEMKQVAIYPGTAPIGGEVIVHGCDLASATVEVNSTNANIVSQDGEHVVFNVPDGLIPLTSYPVTVFRGTTPYPAGNLFTGGAIVGSGATVTSNCPESSLLGCTFKNKANMIDNNMTNYASLGGVLNLGGMYVDVTFTTQIPGGNGQHAGFLIKRGGGLLGANLLGNITVTTYNNGTPVDVATQGSNTLKLTVLSGSVSYVNVETTAPFDEIRLAITGISAGPDFQFYGAYGDYPNQ